MIEERIKAVVRDVNDFPREGIVFKDITPILEEPDLTSDIIDEFYRVLKNSDIDVVVGIESRGFLFGLTIAQKLNVPFILARKEGKLPYKTIKKSYQLEYGEAVIEINQGSIQEGWNVLVHDDLLATGGTAKAVADLIESQNAKVAGFSFLIALKFLSGNQALTKYSNNIITLAVY